MAESMEEVRKVAAEIASYYRENKVVGYEDMPVAQIVELFDGMEKRTPDFRARVVRELERYEMIVQR